MLPSEVLNVVLIWCAMSLKLKKLVSPKHFVDVM